METTEFEQTVFFSAKPIEVYSAFLDPKKQSIFTNSKTTCEQKVGGLFTAWDGYISGKILKLEIGKRILAEWITTEWPEGYDPSIIELTFSEKKGGTELK